MFDILSIIPGKRKLTGSGWHSFNAVCCHHRGHKADRRSRGGIKFDGTTNWSFHCFNCGYKCGFRLGTPIGKSTKQLLIWCGVDETQINKWSIESVQQKDFVDIIPKKKEHKIKFKEHTLPDAELIDSNNPAHKVYIDYLNKRGISNTEYPFMITPGDPGRMANRIIIPYTYKNKIVGHTSRFLDNKIPKYINEQQPGYVFGYDFQKPDQTVCILVEGIFDALSLGACAFMHSTISDEQVELLANLNRKIIFVPDRDLTGLAICDRALELGYSVSIPQWGDDVKDVNDAIVKYGRLPTLLSILESATMNKIKIEIQRNKIVRKLQ
jgi:hypothetical protein